jgi:rubrerythrin
MRDIRQPTAMIRRPILSLGEFLAHGIAIEREAAERYREFEQHFAKKGEEVLSGLCGNLAGHEEEHLREMVERSRSLQLPVIATDDYRWLESASPEAPERELFYSVASPRDLLLLALRSEAGAQFFFAWVARTSPDAVVRELARGMSREEAQHVQWIEQALQYRSPSPIPA